MNLLTRLIALSLVLLSTAAAENVTIRRVPNGGMKPSAAVDDAGVLHLVYFAGDVKGGDAFYVTSRDGGATWSAALRVNSQPGSVLGASNIRGPRLALGRGGRAHVAWNGSGTAKPKAPLNPAMPADSPFNGTPLLYARLADDKKSFEPQRNLMQKTCALDGGSDLAADAEGRVYAVWHAMLPEGKSEADRAVFVAASTDDGRTFAAEKNVLPEPTGTCGCCALAAHTAPNGALAILYRAATDSVHRGMHLLVSRDHAATFTHRALDEWKVMTCPMSAAALLPRDATFFAAWENDGHIRMGNETDPSISPGEGGKGQKLPVLARNPKTNETVLAWTEGTGWNKGGALAWQLLDASGTPISEQGRRDGVPANGSLAVVALPGGKFVLLY